jgi:hypothetical protein
LVWRSYGVRVPSGTIGTAFPAAQSGTCTLTKVDVYQTSPTWVWRGVVMATHAAVSNTASFGIAGGGPTSPAFTSSTVANTVTSEPNSNCPFGGQHLHQWNGGSGTGNAWYHNTNIYPSGGASGNWDPFNWNYWQARTFWNQ